MQVDKTRVTSTIGIQRFKLQYHALLSTFAFKINLRPDNKAEIVAEKEAVEVERDELKKQARMSTQRATHEAGLNQYCNTLHVLNHVRVSQPASTVF